MGEQQNYPPVLLSFSLHSKCLLNQQPAYLLVNGLGTFLLVDEPICLFGDFVLICKENLPLVRQNWISQRASCFVLVFFSVWDECKPWQYRTTSSLFSWWTFSPFSQWAMWKWKKYVYVRIDIRSSAQVDSRDPLLLFHSTCFFWHDIGWLRISQHSSLDDSGRKSKLWIWWSKEHEELHFRAG